MKPPMIKPTKVITTNVAKSNTMNSPNVLPPPRDFRDPSLCCLFPSFYSFVGALGDFLRPFLPVKGPACIVPSRSTGQVPSQPNCEEVFEAEEDYWGWE